MLRLVRVVVCAVVVPILSQSAYTFAKAPEPASGYSVPVPSAEELVKRIKRQHPRLLIDAGGFEGLKKKIAADPVLRQWDKQLLRDAERCLKDAKPAHVLPDGKRLLATSRHVVQHAYTLALAYRLHGDRRYLERLWRDMDTVAAFPDFNPRHFLDTAEMTHGLAIAYDWLYDQWTPAQRKTIRTAIVRMGLTPGMKVYDSRSGWHKAVHNWNQVCNGGLTAGRWPSETRSPNCAGRFCITPFRACSLPCGAMPPTAVGAKGPATGAMPQATT